MMSSNDIRIVINGNEFIIDGAMLSPAGQSGFQQEVLRRLDGIESRVGKLEEHSTAIMIEQANQRGRLDAMQNGLSIWGALICGVIVFVGIFAPKP